jgi:hypothetical protein
MFKDGRAFFAVVFASCPYPSVIMHRQAMHVCNAERRNTKEEGRTRGHTGNDYVEMGANLDGKKNS